MDGTAGSPEHERPDFEREVYGRVPKNVPAVSWRVTQTTNTTVGGIPVVARQLTGHVDNSACPAINVDIQMAVVEPSEAKRPLPLLMMFSNGAMPASPEPPAATKIART